MLLVVGGVEDVVTAVVGARGESPPLPLPAVGRLGDEANRSHNGLTFSWFVVVVILYNRSNYRISFSLSFQNTHSNMEQSVPWNQSQH